MFGFASAVEVFVAACTAVAIGSVGSLDHPTRRRIYDHLMNLPGDHFRSIARCLHIGVGTARHHLGVLEKSGAIFVAKQNGWSRYYPSGEGSEADRNRLYMQHWMFRDLRPRVLRVVQGSRSAGPAEVSRSLGISRQLASYHIIRLADQGYIKRRAYKGRK